MPGWRRNRRSGAPAASPAVSPPRPQDAWRALPPSPTVLRSPVTTFATDAFSDNLSTWHDPSFLLPLGHQVDPGGPAGLITGLASAPANPEPLTYYHDRPLPLAAGRAPAQLQRSISSWSPSPSARSVLITAPEPDLSPVSLPVVSTGPAMAEMPSPEPGHHDEPGARAARCPRRTKRRPRCARGRTSPGRSGFSHRAIVARRPAGAFAASGATACL